MEQVKLGIPQYASLCGTYASLQPETCKHKTWNKKKMKQKTLHHPPNCRYYGKSYGEGKGYFEG